MWSFPRNSCSKILTWVDLQATVEDLQQAVYTKKKTLYPSRQRFSLPAKAGEKRGLALVPGKKLSDYALGSNSVLQFKDLGPQVPLIATPAPQQHCLISLFIRNQSFSKIQKTACIKIRRVFPKINGYSAVIMSLPEICMLCLSNLTRRTDRDRQIISPGNSLPAPDMLLPSCRLDTALSSSGSTLDPWLSMPSFTSVRSWCTTPSKA